MTTKNTAPEAEQKATPRSPQPVGPSAAAADTPLQTVTLSHHLRIGGKDYAPGDKARVTADYARRLRAQGYVART
ncbi:hypothetical protein [Streptomyces longispororuber]|uniref:DUF7210 family protein n=1 Tax=Streptomyces longispororuber TaxID=68230 RepID=UPI0036F7DB43